MRIPSTVFAVGRYALGLMVIAGSVALISAPRKTGFSKHDLAYYADASTVQYVRPGLNINIVSAKIATDGTISVDYKITDVNGSKGQPLDLTGVQTPGTISVSFLAAYIPQGQEQYYSYATRSETESGKTATQAGADSGGTTQTVALGEYIYTFKTKAAAQGGGAFDPNATHRIGIYGSRNLTEFDLGTNYGSATYDFVPAGGQPQPRDVIRTATCDKCHDQLAFHGGSRRGIELCVMCHTPQTTDALTGNTLDAKVFIHKLHMGSSLPSVQAGKPYQISGYQNAISDWSTVELPSDARRCNFCHESTTGATQANAWLTSPSRAACGACHDDVNFASGQNHAGGPQVDDTLCATCHIPQGNLEFDASIKGAHTIPQESATAPGINLKILKVDNGVAGKAPSVTFTIKDNSGNGISMAQMTGGSNRLALVMAGPTSDYGTTVFGSDVSTPGYVSENPVPTAQCSPDGTCLYTFTHAIPANVTGTFAIGMEGRRGLTILPGTTEEQSTEYGAKNVVYYFSVDGSPVQPRRTVVAINNCNQCHARLSVHGENRNQIEMCVLCHNPNDTDVSMRPLAKQAAQKSMPPQAINFAQMVHKIHTGENIASFNRTYVIVGYGGSINDFSNNFAAVPASIKNTGVRFPAMSPTGGVGDTTNCDICHANGSEAVFPIGKNAVVDPQGPLSPIPATQSACTGCHLNISALAHAQTNTDPKFGESCDVCHGSGAQFDVDKIHAGK